MTPKLLIGLATGLLLVGLAGRANALSFSNTIDFTGHTSGGVTYTEVTDDFSFTHTIPGLTTPPDHLTDATLSIRHYGNADNLFEAWFSSAENGKADIAIGELGKSSSGWKTDTFTLSAAVLNLMDNGSPWSLKINLKECAWLDWLDNGKLKLDYSTLAGHYTTDSNGTGGPTPAPEPATMILMGTGIAGLVRAYRKKKA